MSYDYLRQGVLELFAEHNATDDTYVMELLAADQAARGRVRSVTSTWREMERALEPAAYAFTPEGFAGEAQRLTAIATDRDSQREALIASRRVRQRERRRERYATPEFRARERERVRAYYSKYPERQKASARASYQRKRERILAKKQRSGADPVDPVADDAALEARRERRREYMREYTKTPKMKAYFAAKAREFYQRHKEKLLSKRASTRPEYYQRNRERILAKRAANKAANAEYMRKWRAANPDKVKANQERFLAKKDAKIAAKRREQPAHEVST